MFKNLIKTYLYWRSLKKQPETIESYLNSDGFELHDNTNNRVVYVKNLVTIFINQNCENSNGKFKIKKGDITVVELCFIPDLTLLKYFIKNYVKNKVEVC